MNIVQLSDGLGNQLFQYAFALALQQQTGRHIMLDRSWFPEYGGKLRKAVHRPYALGAYKLGLAMASRLQTHELMYGKGIVGTVRKMLHIKKGLAREADLPEPLTCADECVVKGFFQKARYADSVRDQLLQDLALPETSLNPANRSMLSAIRAEGERAVCVHVRRGDYVRQDTQQVHGLCGEAYYQQAETLLAEKVGHALHLFIFSDDPEWVRTHYKSTYPITCVDINTAAEGYRDINLMRHCRHAIVANSTFSWWGSWLIPHEQKICIAPQKWRADGTDTTGLLPDSWYTI